MSKKIASPNFEPRLVTSNKTAARQRINADAGSGGVNFTIPMPFRPEFGSEDRVFYPIDRLQANRQNQLYYKLDGTIGTVIDMYAEIIGSQFHLSGEGVEGEVKDAFELSLEKTMAIAAFPMFIKYYLVFGECIPHLTFDTDKKIWTNLMLHNPDQISVTSAPMLKIPDILEYTPDETLRKLARSNHPVIQMAMSTLPPEVMAALISGQGIPLDTITNVTFLARKQFAHEIRGTSILSRLYRILMIEDAIAQTTIQTARRHCFVAGTPVLMSGGLRNIEDVKIGDRVITGEGNIKEVEDAWEEPAAANLVEIKALGSEPLVCTETHKFKVWKQDKYCKCGCGGITTQKSNYILGHHCVRDAKTGRFNQKANEWDNYSAMIKRIRGENPIKEVEAKDIDKGDYLLIPRKFEEVPSKISKEQARLLGYYLAEGGLRTCNKYKTVSFFFGGHEHTTIALEAHEYCQQLGLSSKQYLVYQKNDETRKVGCSKVEVFRVKDMWFTEWCVQHGGNRCTTKQLSEEVMSWPLHLKEELIRGYFRGDGHFNAKLQQASATSVSKTLIYQIRLILAQLGIFGTIYKQKKKNPKWNTTYTVASNGGDGRKLAKLVWDKDIEFLKTSQLRTFMDADYIYIPVQKVKNLDIVAKTYNLTIKDDHSYTIGGVSTLNSSPLKIARVGMMLPDGNPWMPEVGFEDKIVQLLAAAETDPHSFLILPWHVQFEAFGTTDRAQSLRNEYDTIEKIKLTALGVSSEFMHGQASYNSMQGQLQVLMMRMSNLRNYFEQMWWLPKFFRPMSELNNFIKPTDAEVAHRVKFRRSKKELLEDNRYIIPTMNWTRQLDPKVDNEALNIYEQIINRIGQPISRSTILSAANLDREVEDNNLGEEAKVKLPKENKPSGDGGELPAEIPEGEVPVEETPEGETIELEIPGASKQSKKIPAYQEDLETFIEFIQTKKPTKFWARILKKDEKPEEFIKKLGNGNIERVVDFLEDTGYNYKEIEGFKRDLSNEVEIPTEVKEDVVASLIDSLAATGSGKDIDNVIDTFIKTEGKDLGLESLIGKGRLRELDLVKG